MFAFKLYIYSLFYILLKYNYKIKIPINGIVSHIIGTLLEIIINSKHIMIRVTPLNINFSDDSGGNQKTESVSNTTTKI